MIRLGIDLGGTNVRVGLLQDGRLQGVEQASTPLTDDASDVLDRMSELIERFPVDKVDFIGAGVPSVVDVETGVVYDVQNIPSWTEVPLGAWLEDSYEVPVVVQNDANCFALAEYHFGKGQETSPMVGLIVGTGFAGGLVLDGELYSGHNCGAGEFGTMPYRDGIYEQYCAGQFFERVYDVTGKEAFRRAKAGDKEAQAMFDELGTHLGSALQAVLYAVDPECIVMGGSVTRAYPFFEDALWETMQSFAYPRSVDRLTLEISKLEYAGVLGAAALGFSHPQSIS